MKGGNSDVVVRVYLMLYSSLGTSGESRLRTFSIDCGRESSDLECGEFEGKGSSVQSPFYAFKIGFKQIAYDYDALTDDLNKLFDCIQSNKSKIFKLLDNGEVKTTFGINFNCKNRDHKPAFDLMSDQLELLGEIGATISLDTYFDF